MNNKLLMSAIGIAVGIILLGSLLVPVLDDAQTVKTPNKVDSSILLADYTGEPVTVQFIPSPGHYNELIVDGKTYTVDGTGIILYCDTFTITSRLYNGQTMLDNWNVSTAYDTAGYGQEFTVVFDGSQWTMGDRSGEYSELYIISDLGSFCSVSLTHDIRADADSTLIIGRPGSGTTSRIITAPEVVTSESIATSLYTPNSSTWAVTLEETASITWDAELGEDGAYTLSNFAYTGSTSINTSGLYAVVNNTYTTEETASYAGILSAIPIMLIVSFLAMAVGVVSFRER